MRPLPLLFSLLLASSAFSQTVILSGTVTDSSTGEALPGANIRIEGTNRGTITNAQGAYSIALPAGPSRLIFSFIGYRTDTLRVALLEDERRNVALQPTIIRMAEVVVTSEDPAYRIMRNVIENKKK